MSASNIMARIKFKKKLYQAKKIISQYYQEFSKDFLKKYQDDPEAIIQEAGRIMEIQDHTSLRLQSKKRVPLFTSDKLDNVPFVPLFTSDKREENIIKEKGP